MPNSEATQNTIASEIPPLTRISGELTWQISSPTTDKNVHFLPRLKLIVALKTNNIGVSNPRWSHFREIINFRSGRKLIFFFVVGDQIAVFWRVAWAIIQ